MRTSTSGLTGVSNHMWKGDKVGYRALHYWLVRVKGHATQCEQCGAQKTTPKSIQWANKSGKYLRDMNDWIGLCVPCHRLFDMTIERKKQLVKNFGVACKLCESDVVSIFKDSKSGMCNKDIASKYHIDESNVRLILNRKTWKHVEVPT